jgi:HAD superfamily hydrolase (TIGR01509 family)
MGLRVARGCRVDRVSSIPAVILDCDGLLVDTEAAWRAATADVFPASDIHLTGASVGQLVELHMNGSLSDREQLAEKLTQALLAHVDDLARPLPGAAALLAQLQGRPHAIASNAPREVVVRALACLGDDAVRVEIVGLAPPLRPKPEPDLHLEACHLVNSQPSNAIAFEDSIIGARAARAAGLRVVGVGADPDLRLHTDTFLPNLEDARVFELLDLPPHSPPLIRKES